MNERGNSELSKLKISTLDDKGKEVDVSENVGMRVWVDKPDFSLKITGKLEIDFNDNFKTIKDFEIEAKTLEILIKKLLNEITQVSLNKLHEGLQFLIKNRSEE